MKIKRDYIFTTVRKLVTNDFKIKETKHVYYNLKIKVNMDDINPRAT